MSEGTRGAATLAAPARRAAFVVTAVTLVASASCVASVANQNLAAAMASAPGAVRADAPISMPEEGLRRFVALKDEARIKTAMAATEKDTLLRMLNWGLIYHRLGRYQESNASLQAADREADDRYTKSVSQNLGALLKNDLVLDYNPGAHERAFTHYYGMLNYLALGKTEDALVEARAVDEFLRRYARENGARSYTHDAMVHYLAGMLHLSDNDQNDAIVSLRTSAMTLDSYSNKYGVTPPQFVGADLARLATTMGITDVASDISARFQLRSDQLDRPAGSGTLLVLIENGYIAYRAEQKLYIPLLPSESGAITDAPSALIVGGLVALRAKRIFEDANNNPYASDYRDGLMFGVVANNADMVTMAWPKYVLNTNGVDEITVRAGTATQTPLVMDDLSAIAVRAFEEDKPKIVGRMITRGLTKYAATKLAESQAAKLGDKAGGFGKVAGFLGKQISQGVASATEKADTRSWSLLPGEIRVARFVLPAGMHDVTVDVVDADGRPRTFALGSVKIAENGVTVRTQFVEGQYRGSVRRFAAAQKGIDYKASGDVALGEASTVLAFGAGSAGVAIAQSGTAVAPAATRAAPVGPPRAATSVTAVSMVTSGGFKPLLGEPAKFALRMRTPTPAANRASTSLLVVKTGTTDTLRAWSGTEGDTASWNGMVNDTPATAGTYQFVWRTVTPGAAATTDFISPAVIEVDRPKIELTPPPSEPKVEPETRMVMRPDYQKRGAKRKSGIVIGLLGGGLATFGYMQIGSAIESSAPGSPERMTALGIWGGGVLLSTIGGISTLQGLVKSYSHEVSEPDGGAIDRNKTARDDYDRVLAEIKAQQETLKNETVMRIRIGGAPR